MKTSELAQPPNTVTQPTGRSTQQIIADIVQSVGRAISPRPQYPPRHLPPPREEKGIPVEWLLIGGFALLLILRK